jgi:hypothetical protein
MYHKSGVAKLSHNQILKLLRGHSVRIRHGNHHVLHLSKEQHKKMMKAHGNGKQTTICFDPYQMQMHRGKGFFDKFKPIADKLIDTALPVVANIGEKFIAKKLGLGKKKSHHGEGFTDVINKVSDVALPIATKLGERFIAKKLGLGKKKHEVVGTALNPAGYGSKRRKRGRPKKARALKFGRGIGDDILKGVQAVAPFLPLLL